MNLGKKIGFVLAVILLVVQSNVGFAGRTPKLAPIKMPKFTNNERPSKPSPTYPGTPKVQSIEPAFGPRHGWTRIDVKGSGFKQGCRLLIGGKEALETKFVSGTRIRARTPEHTVIGSVDIVVRNPGGKAGGLLNGFLYEGSLYELPGYNMVPTFFWTASIAFVDMNGDRKKDMILANGWTKQDSIVIHLAGVDRDGDGVPNFDPLRHNQSLRDTANFTGLCTADLDKDGDVDIVGIRHSQSVNQITRAMSNVVFLNDGKCNFTKKQLPGEAATGGAEVGDLNGDGVLDLVIANADAQSQLFFGDGKGGFKDVTATHFPKAKLWTTYIHLVDVDGDKDLDAVLAKGGSKKAKAGGPNLLYINNGKGHFSNKTKAMGFPSGKRISNMVKSADFDKDGDLDLVVANRKASNQLLVNSGRGKFSAVDFPPYYRRYYMDNKSRIREGVPKLEVSRSNNQNVLVQDINGDGYPDVALCGTGVQALFYINGGGKGGSIKLEARPDLLVPLPVSHGGSSIEMGDIDGDGRPDLTIASGGEQNPLWINAWPKGFKFATCNTKMNLPYTTFVTRCSAIGDVDGDGRLDIVMGYIGHTEEREVFVFLNKEEGWKRTLFMDDSILNRESRVEAVALVDVDRDKDLDLVLGMTRSPSYLLMNDGKGKFSRAKGQAGILKTQIGTRKIFPTDVDRDGDMDLVMCNWQEMMVGLGKQKNSLFINDGKGRFTDRASELLPPEKCAGRGGDVGDVNNDGYPDIVFACLGGIGLPGTGKGTPNRLYLNQGKGRGKFVNASHLLPANKFKSADAAFCDVDKDGRLDIAFANEVKGGLKGGEDNLYHQRSDGKFEDWSARLPRINRNSWSMSALDFNQDGATDLYLHRTYRNYGWGMGPKGEYGRISFYVNDGKGNFSLPLIDQFPPMASEYDRWVNMCPYDLDGDGYPELIENVDGQVRIFKTYLRTKAIAHPVYAEAKVGVEIEFDAGASHLAYGLAMRSAEWSFGDGKKAVGNRVRHAYTRAGTYSVILKVKDSAGRADEDKVTIRVK